ncbi:hypothetical protein M407DRAFT_208486 [Tulasnella calospora MUT 4182]|uniref:Uncharacterized protein n=1 Tax=Tulasnella calospora MUT 4182 TaxID=1051891 RepID=A0A0C3KVX1_9AGAM|nr:hypothetical protein M407DRAFT_208486 [Tulasnella calospora MUT 4182]
MGVVWVESLALGEGRNTKPREVRLCSDNCRPLLPPCISTCATPKYAPLLQQWSNRRPSTSLSSTPTVRFSLLFVVRSFERHVPNMRPSQQIKALGSRRSTLNRFWHWHKSRAYNANGPPNITISMIKAYGHLRDRPHISSRGSPCKRKRWNDGTSAAAPPLRLCSFDG